MAQPLTLEDGIGRKELEAIRRRFTEFQRKRLQRILEDLPLNQQAFVQLLPLLFHINHPLLPGFISNETAAGIADYTPSRETLRAAQRLSRTFRYRRQALKRPLIQALYLVGYNGSIGETQHQRIEAWLCHDATLADTEQAELAQKCERIAEWGWELHMEVRIRLLQVDPVHQDRQHALTVHAPPLLLEEFYRNGLLLAGLHPLWWFVPPQHESEYRDYTQMLVERRFVAQQDCLDFGGLETFSPETLFDAALYHLDKGIDKPYEKLLQILLMECYLRDYPHPSWLAWEMKKAVYEGEAHENDLDPYLVLYRHLERRLQALGHPHRLDLARRALYFRSGIQLSRSRDRGWRRTVIARLAHEWGWDDERLRVLDKRPEWKIRRVMEERNSLMQELSNGYRLLASFGRHLGDKRSATTLRLSLLGRKLYTSWEQRAGKVDRINPGISANIRERRLSLHQEGEGGWQLYRGEVGAEEVANTPPIRSSETLVDMLAWCRLNAISTPETQFFIHTEETRLSQTELHAILRILAEVIPPTGGMAAQPKALEHPPHLRACTLFINIGHDPMETLVREGNQLTSNRSDPLSFSSTRTSLVHDLEQLTLTSWGEWLVRRYEGTEGVLDALCNYLTTSALDGDKPPPETVAHCFSSLKGTMIGQRVAALFNQAAHLFFKHANSRYVCEIGNAYYMIQNGGRGFFWLQFSTPEELLDELEQPIRQPMQVELAAPVLEESPLPALYRHHQEGRTQLFYFYRNGRFEFFVLDEYGALFRDALPTETPEHTLIHLQRFLATLSKETPTSPEEQGPVQIYRLNRSRDGDWQVNPHTPIETGDPGGLEVRLTAHEGCEGGAPFALRCGERLFSSTEYGANLFSAVAHHIFSLRSGNDRYPIYVTAIETGADESTPVKTGVELFAMKKRIERRLNQAAVDGYPHSVNRL